MSRRNSAPQEVTTPEFDERIVDLARVAKVIKGGRRFAFRAVVVSGDNRGRVGVGIGKANTATDSIRKASERSRRNMIKISMVGTTVPHEAEEKFGGAVVFMKPATPGTGVIAGGAVRAVLEAAGVHDILTKSKGSNNKLNMVMATFRALQMMKSVKEEAERRSKSTDEVKPVWS
ncbi:MAG TPA: 30S ribosomal protein S5 [Anaerolineales bacterium]|nr:30S ribosomal protein S5 [Anaerolineales bacterium]